MSILDRILNRVGYMNRGEVMDELESIKATVTNPPAWLRATSEYERVKDINLDTPKKQATLYRKLSWINTAVHLVAEQAAGVNFRVLKQAENEEKERVDSHEFELLLQRPNPTQSRVEFLVDTASNYKLTGNSFWWMNKANEFAEPSEMFTIPTHMIRPIPDGNMFLDGYEYDPGDGRLIAIPPYEIIHFKAYNPFSRYWGWSQIMPLATISIGDLAMQRHNTEFFSGAGAKLAGLLAFAESIPNPAWEVMKADIKEASQRRDLMMLRNVGKEGVEWIKTGMSQAEMEFIAGRTMNKEEIYDLMAPGLASWLAINATEANSRSGKEAFSELAVYPVHQVIQEKITLEILPLYGENLLGEFDDVRPVNQKILIEEQKATANIMTVDEQRKKFLKLEPIGDERGDMLASLVRSLDADVEVDPEIGEDEEEEENPQEEFEKEDERVKFRRYVRRRKEADGFVFHYLNEDEQAALKGELGASDTKRVEFLIKAVDAMVESVTV